ncbi:hypothetical protein RSSM_06718 [Rhodopirellula sallentina SM41]|uniref:Uncharacterized protein n=1 Tax=Rhodopirellula sallentina SM41 TaxID=1263870 RepID=M5U1V9_9BACT|nr:hypothetical protein RSSM_06718 [Rhodopirellula sallentina SM41]
MPRDSKDLAEKGAHVFSRPIHRSRSDEEGVSLETAACASGHEIDTRGTSHQPIDSEQA